MGDESNSATISMGIQQSQNYGAGTRINKAGGNLTVNDISADVTEQMAVLSRDVALGGLSTGRDVALGGLALVGGYGELMGDVIHSQANSAVEMAQLQKSVLLGAMGQNKDLFESTVDRLGTLSETKMTEGASNMQRSLLIGFGLLIAGVIAFFIFGRK